MKILSYKSGGIRVSWKEFREQFKNFIVSSGIGFEDRNSPGLGPPSQPDQHSVSKNMSRHPEKYGPAASTA